MKKTLFITGIILILVWLAGFIVFAHRINSYPLDTTSHTQAIIALTGGRNRIYEAVKLLNQGVADKLFISGVSRNNSLNSIRNRQHLPIKNCSNIFLGKKARNTIGNAVETINWIKANRINSIRLVTSNYHIERSLVEFKSRAPALTIIAHPVYSEKVAKKWWTSWHSFSLIFAEYNKFIYAYIRSFVLN